MFTYLTTTRTTIWKLWTSSFIVLIIPTFLLC